MPGAHGADEVLLGFARALRASGVQVTADRERTYLQAVAEVGLQDREATYCAGRATLCSSPADLERYDQVYAAWFGGGLGAAGAAPRRPQRTVTVAYLAEGGSAGGEPSPDDDLVRAMASTATSPR